MSEVTLAIPYDCLASSNERNRRKGGRGHSWGYKQALEAIHLHAKKEVTASGRPLFPKGTPVEVTLHFYWPDFRWRDEANYLKCLMDGIEGVVYADDHQVVRLSYLRKQPDAENPRCEVEVRRRAVA